MFSNSTRKQIFAINCFLLYCVDTKKSMILKLSIVFTLFSTISTISTNSLVDLPLKVPKGSTVINATLFDNGNQKVFIQELISASDRTIKGKILVSSDKDLYSIHYIADSYNGVDRKERLVIHGTDCLILTYKNSWDKTLPGIDDHLLNQILLLGPSILYRLDSSFAWKSVEDKNIRGIMMKGVSTEIKNLKITFYYKSHFDFQTGMKSPSRIEFSGHDSSHIPNPGEENLILYLDIYSILNENSADLIQNEVQPAPGIGCPYYLAGINTLPRLIAFHLHCTIEERIKGSTSSRTISQVYAAQYYDFLRLKSSFLGSTTEIIYDYQLGLSYNVRTDGSVVSTPIELNSPGIDRYGKFTLSSLFMLHDYFNYLGKLNLEHGSRIPVEAWESVQYNVNINGKKADKAVITQYFAKSHDYEIFAGYALVSTKISIYDYDQSKKVYTLTDEITRDYMNFRQARSMESIRSLTEKADFASSDEKLILNFIFECDVSNCIKHLEEHVYLLKADFIHYVLLREPVSSLRIDDIQYRFTGTNVEIEVSFFDLPHLELVFTPKSVSVSQDTFTKMIKIKASNDAECLDKVSQYISKTIKVVIFRPTDLVCGYLSNPEDFKEDVKQGQPCNVYFFPLDNLYRIKQELALDQIHDAYLREIGREYDLLREFTPIKIKLTDVIDRTKKEIYLDGYNVHKINHDTKLKTDDKSTVTVPDVKTFADCYRSCHNSEQVACMTFSFCNTDGTIDCRVSSLQESDVTYQDTVIEPDRKCSIFSLSAIDEYSKITKRKFINQLSTAIETDFYSCATVCRASSDCISFQYCGGYCSFGDLLYTDEATKYDEECMIYTPKVSERYQKTGNKIVSDLIATKTKLTLDQCASLCYELFDGDETGCKSFNYCPKSRTESSCELTHFSVKSPSTKTTDRGHCSNYELKVESNGKKLKESSSTEVIKGTSGSGAFGIIMLFLFVGALLGLATPFAYSKVKQMHDVTNTNVNFTWRRQQYEQQLEDAN